MSKVGFLVELDIDPMQRESFDESMRQHSKATLAGEKGCLAFDVYVHTEDPNRYALYEQYADEAALDVHRFSDRLAKHRQEVDHLIQSARIWMVGEEVDRSNFPGMQDCE